MSTDSRAPKRTGAAALWDQSQNQKWMPLFRNEYTDSSGHFAQAMKEFPKKFHRLSYEELSLNKIGLFFIFLFTIHKDSLHFLIGGGGGT